MMRFYRILLDPTPTEAGANNGGAATSNATTATSGQQQQAAAVQRAQPQTVAVDLDEWTRLRQSADLLSTIQQQQAEATRKAEQDRLQALAEKGKAEEILKELREKHTSAETEWKTKFAELESSYHGEKKAATVGLLLSGVQWVSDDARAQALELINGKLAVTKAGDGSTVVVDKLTGRPASAVIPELLGSPAFAHFQKPRGQGGSGASGGDRPSTSTGDAPVRFEDRVFEAWQKANDDPSLPSWQRPARIVGRN